MGGEKTATYLSVFINLSPHSNQFVGSINILSMSCLILSKCSETIISTLANQTLLKTNNLLHESNRFKDWLYVY